MASLEMKLRIFKLFSVFALATTTMMARSVVGETLGLGELRDFRRIGYFYPKPENPLIENVSRNQTDSNLNLLVDGGEKQQEVGGLPPMKDFVDDLIDQQKQLIFASLGAEPTDTRAADFNKCASCSCGIPNINRIVGGSRVKGHKYPWIAQILTGALLFCGGTLINDRYVLSAAHCLNDVKGLPLTVRLLQLDRSSAPDKGLRRKVSAVYKHSGYSRPSQIHDIALLKLDRPVPLLEPLRPACLPSSRYQNFDYRQAVVAGWGRTREDGIESNVLMEASVPIITNAQCRATSYHSMILETMLCAGYVDRGGKDACQGDSGGPLVVRDQTVFRLAGIISYGYGCAKPNAPGVYTRVSRYLDWISVNTRDACYCAY